jgi:plasmid stabilization system protein ParE
MKVKWDPTARADMRQVARYINEKFGRKTRQDFIQRVREAEKLIVSQPNIGPVDPLYSNRPVTYRSITVNGLNKMVYRIDGNVIYIVDFWDTRREPTNQAAQTQ